ncbi:MAG: STAS domain-containing protein [Desulfitobacteriaceae bacterium]|nr:STAS domain-containing protein [Desulfitobacteriaceae bacterium]MDI6916068.1 STAS domain-containing protein [Desulfitobacteriaceae bacterium]
MLSIHTKNENSSHIVKLVGVLDISTVDKFNEYVHTLDSVLTLIIDFSELEFIDSTGIGAILRVIYRSQDEDFSVELEGLQENIREIFEMVGVMKVLEAMQK